MKEVSLKGRIVSIYFILKYYMHRYIRLTIPYFFALVISICLTKYMGEGPLYPKDGFERDTCRSYWWMHLLYLNNYNSIIDNVR